MKRLLPLLVAGCLPGLIDKLSEVPYEPPPNFEGHHRVTVGRETYNVGPYWGPECERLDVKAGYVSSDGTMSRRAVSAAPTLAEERADRIYRMVCSEALDRDTTWLVQLYRFDELAFDQVTAAEVIAQCALVDTCLGGSDGELIQAYEVAMLRWYADRIDIAEVDKQISLLGLRADAKAAFLALVQRTKATIVDKSDHLVPEAKRLFVDLPASIHQKREAELLVHRDMIDKLVALRDRVAGERGKGVGDDTIEQLRSLRVAYHATCKTDCTHGPLFAAITEQLFWAYISRGDSPGAQAEAKLLEHRDPPAAAAIVAKQREAIAAAHARGKRVAAAREKGVDADTARSLGQAGLDLGDGNYLPSWGDDTALDYASLVPDKLDEATGKVIAVDKKGATATVRFADELSTWTESTNCYESNRVDGIDSDGKLIYREVCTGEASHTDRTAVPPITVPASEASGLRGGDEVVAFVRGDRSGRIWMVKRGERVVRLREVPL